MGDEISNSSAYPASGSGLLAPGEVIGDAELIAACLRRGPAGEEYLSKNASDTEDRIVKVFRLLREMTTRLPAWIFFARSFSLDSRVSTYDISQFAAWPLLEALTEGCSAVCRHPRPRRPGMTLPSSFSISTGPSPTRQ